MRPIEQAGSKSAAKAEPKPLNDLLSCPFCDVKMRVESNRDWHRLKGDHDDECIWDTDEDVLMVSALEENLAWMVAAWNRRAAR
jgi:hypothetical protein